MRGKASTSCFFSASYRITPAYAGKREQSTKMKSASWDHPRLCGEKPDTIRGIMTNIGSPPPMRGKGKRGKNNGNSCRITPAYAGKSSANSGSIYGTKGSPPPMRGKVFLAPLVLSVIRITPAYAGKSRFAHYGERGERDHPRLCGEKKPPPLQSAEWLGSPPPMRGKV